MPGMPMRAPTVSRLLTTFESEPSPFASSSTSTSWKADPAGG